MNNISKSTSKLSERAQRLLKTLIERYIDAGQPIGSKFLAKESGLDLSAASIRNVLAELEDLGLIMSPHTSAGRVPTNRGYRMFVDSLITVEPLSNIVINQIKQQLTLEMNSEKLLTSASEMLSEVTSMASIVMLPRRDQKSLRQIEFLPLSDNRVLAIMVVNNCEVENRIIHAKRNYAQDELQKISNFLNAAFSGKDIQSVRQNLIGDLNKARQDVYEFMGDVVEMADQLFPAGKDEEAFMVTGHSNLMHFQEMADMEKLRVLFDAFKQKRDILDVLDQCMLAQRMQVFIGAECGRQMFDDYTLVTSPYTFEGEVMGVLGVIGPTRMRYEKVIPAVDVTAKLLSSVLHFKK